jgi:hypothetical protein
MELVTGPSEEGPVRAMRASPLRYSALCGADRKYREQPGSLEGVVAVPAGHPDLRTTQVANQCLTGDVLLRVLRGRAHHAFSTLRGKVTSQTPVCPDPTRVAVIPPVWLVIAQESPFGTSAASTLSAVPAEATWSLAAFLLMIFLTCFFSCEVRALAAMPVPTNETLSVLRRSF